MTMCYPCCYSMLRAMPEVDLRLLSLSAITTSLSKAHP